LSLLLSSPISHEHCWVESPLPSIAIIKVQVVHIFRYWNINALCEDHLAMWKCWFSTSMLSITHMISASFSHSPLMISISLVSPIGWLNQLLNWGYMEVSWNGGTP
jgi:hypothetical protein